MKRIQLSVRGMHCDACVQAIQDALGRLDGIESVTARLGEVEVCVDPLRCRISSVMDAVHDAGKFEVASFREV